MMMILMTLIPMIAIEVTWRCRMIIRSILTRCCIRIRTLSSQIWPQGLWKLIRHPRWFQNRSSKLRTSNKEWVHITIPNHHTTNLLLCTTNQLQYINNRQLSHQSGNAEAVPQLWTLTTTISGRKLEKMKIPSSANLHQWWSKIKLKEAKVDKKQIWPSSWNRLKMTITGQETKGLAGLKR